MIILWQWLLYNSLVVLWQTRDLWHLELRVLPDFLQLHLLELQPPVQLHCSLCFPNEVWSIASRSETCLSGTSSSVMNLDIDGWNWMTMYIESNTPEAVPIRCIPSSRISRITPGRFWGSNGDLLSNVGIRISTFSPASARRILFYYALPSFGFVCSVSLALRLPCLMFVSLLSIQQVTHHAAHPCPSIPSTEWPQVVWIILL